MKNFTIHLQGHWDGISNKSHLIGIKQVTATSKIEAQKKAIVEHGGKFIKQPPKNLTDGVFVPHGYTHGGHYLLSAIVL
jgi:hypothetical protein